LHTQRADIDVKWEGAPKPVLLRPYAGFDDEKGDTLMHLAVVGSTKTSSPLHLTYFSFLLQVSARHPLLNRDILPCRWGGVALFLVKGRVFSFLYKEAISTLH
jgi:hypothetical protein